VRSREENPAGILSKTPLTPGKEKTQSSGALILRGREAIR
jgi:hypothetical protein